jgi:hypothetical protein
MSDLWEETPCLLAAGSPPRSSPGGYVIWYAERSFADYVEGHRERCT